MCQYQYFFKKKLDNWWAIVTGNRIIVDMNQNVSMQVDSVSNLE